MGAILTKAGSYIGIVLLGYLLRRIGWFKKEDFHVLSVIVVRITLTATIVVNFAGRELELSLLIMTVLAVAFGVLLMIIAYFVNAPGGRQQQAFAVLNTPGCNIGNFALPFAQGFLTPLAVMAISLFDAGNGLICMGGSYSIACTVQDENARFSPKLVLKNLSKSVPLMTYFIMLALCALHITPPAAFCEFAGIISAANPFLAMFMIGVGFELTGEPGKTGTLLRVLGVRYGVGLALAVISFLWFPLPLDYRQALVILFLSPIGSVTPAFTAQMKGDYGLSSAINSISILISIVAITAALLIIL